MMNSIVIEEDDGQVTPRITDNTYSKRKNYNEMIAISEVNQSKVN